MQNTLPVVISGVHMFLPLGMSVSGDVEWHFLLQLLLPHYINLFQSDVHSLIDKLFSSGSHRFADAVKCAIFLCLGSLCHVGQQSVRHGRVRFNASLVRLGNVCHRSTDVRHGLVFFNISVVPWSFKSCRSTKCPSQSCVFNTWFVRLPI